MTAAAPVERPAATLRLPNGLAYAIAAVYVVAALVLLAAITISGASWGDALTAHQLHNIDLAAVLGVLILRRQPGHVIGWSLVGVGAFETVCLLSRAYQFLGLPSGAAVENQLAGFWVPASALLLIAVPQLFPDGRLLSRRWRPPAWFGALAAAFLTTAFLLDPTGTGEGLQTWPFAVGFPLFGVAVLTSLAPAAVRFRRSHGTERQQFKWVIYGLSVSGVLLAVGAVQITGGESQANSALTLVAQAVIPIAFTVAVLRYRLYDIDLVINKTVVFVALAAFITAVYAGIVVGLGRLLPIDGGDLGLSVAATALVAVAFEPVRARVQHAANRLVYGRRASPYEALAAMTAHLGETADAGAGLAEAARLLADGTGAAGAVVWVVRNGHLVPVATTGPDTEPEPVPLQGVEPPPLPGADLVTPVHHDGRLVGALSLTKRPGEGVSTADRKLVRELAGQATLLLANTRLRARLRERLEELRASRQRLLAAQDKARHSLERDLHDGAQQEIVACKITIGLARTIAAKEGETGLAAGLDDAAAAADGIVDALREVARGIYPPLLESDGLVAALGAQARRAGLDVRVTDRGVARYPREIEATAYFCAVEAVQNAVRHAGANHIVVDLDGTGPALTLTVTDDGAGFDPDRTPPGTGLAHMTDRADATGGTLTVASDPGHGTAVSLVLPTPVPDTPPAEPPVDAGPHLVDPAGSVAEGSSR